MCSSDLLDWGQAAPVGFLWAEKAVAGLLEPTARALRLVPCLAGILGLVWTWQVGRRTVGALAAVIATVIVAFSLIGLRYAAEVKPYATDAATAIGLVGVAVWVAAGAHDVRRWAALGFAGTVAVVCSLPSVFVLAACGMALGADAVMIGRAAQGRPWIFRETAHYLATGEHLAPPLVAEVRRALLAHLQDHYGLYGEYTGVRSARKHIGWYVRSLPGGEAFRERMNTLQGSAEQLAAVADFFDGLAQQMDRLPQATATALEMSE